MSSKGASRYGRDGLGAWHADANGLPCYRLDTRQAPPFQPGYSHIIGTGSILVTADQWGRIGIVAGDAGRRFSLGDAVQGPVDPLRVAFHVGARALHLLPGAVPEAWSPALDWGMGYVSYALAVRDPVLPAALACSISLDAIPGKPYVLVTLGLRLAGKAAAGCSGTLAVSCDVRGAGGIADHPAAAFAREGIAILALGDDRGELFLAGSRSWAAASAFGRLSLRQDVSLAAGESIGLRLLLGCVSACSVQWVRAEFEGLTAEAVRAATAARADAAPAPGPELWMREEALWCRAALQAFQARDARSGWTILNPHADTRTPRTAPLLALCPFAQAAWRDTVRHTLEAVALRQGPDGRLPETLDGPAPPADLRHCRSDTEIWFLWAWSQWLSGAGNRQILQERSDRNGGRGPTLLERLLLTLRWIRHGIGTGPRGLVRLLGGDWNGLLDRAGGLAGESVLSTSVLCAALWSLAEICREERLREPADTFAALWSEFAQAVSAAFRDGAFLRGFTDAGDCIGAPVPGPVFADVQAWAVLGRCGTVSQRRQALDGVLAAGGEGPLRALSKAFPGTWPATLGSIAWRPGEAANGGVTFPEAAWFMQALIVEGRVLDAQAQYRRLSPRRRAASTGAPPFPALVWAAALDGQEAGRREGWPSGHAAGCEPPAAFAVAWPEDILRRAAAPPARGV